MKQIHLNPFCVYAGWKQPIIASKFELPACWAWQMGDPHELGLQTDNDNLLLSRALLCAYNLHLSPLHDMFQTMSINFVLVSARSSLSQPGLLLDKAQNGPSARRSWEAHGSSVGSYLVLLNVHLSGDLLCSAFVEK